MSAPPVGLEWIGWIATAVFGASYFCARPAALRSVQACAALLWITYGALIAARPVIVANAIVALLAAWSAWRERRASSLDAHAHTARQRTAPGKPRLEDVVARL